MPMSELPPADLIVEKLKFAVLPAAVTSGVVFGLGILLAWLLSRRWRAIAPSLAVLALAAGVAVAPLLKAWNEAQVAAAKAAGDTERATALETAYPFEKAFPWVPDGKWWHWGWYAVGLALLAEFVARMPGVGIGVGHLIRGVAAGLIASAVVPPDWQKPETRWWLPLAAGLVAAVWAVADAVGRRNPGGGVAAAVAVVCNGAAAVLIHDAAAGFTDVATYLMVGLSVLTVFAWVTRTDAGSAGAVATVPVAAMLLINYDLRSSAPPVPTASYWLIGLAPLMLLPFLFPRVIRSVPWWLATPVKVLLVAIPVGIAVYRCLTEAPLTFGDKW